jgi:hypothetical protein
VPNVPTGQQYQRIDQRSDAFFPIFVRELNYLAQKVVVNPRGGELIADVKALHQFLVRYADRVVGEDIPLEVQGRFLRCAVMIVARAYKRELGDRQPYLRHLRDLDRAGHETIYLIGSAASENRDFMVAIAGDFTRETGWTEVNRREHHVILRYPDGDERKASSLLIVMRSNQARDYIGEAAVVDLPQDMMSLPDVEATA